MHRITTSVRPAYAEFACSIIIDSEMTRQPLFYSPVCPTQTGDDATIARSGIASNYEKRGKRSREVAIPGHSPLHADLRGRQKRTTHYSHYAPAAHFARSLKSEKLSSSMITAKADTVGVVGCPKGGTWSVATGSSANGLENALGIRRLVALTEVRQSGASRPNAHG